MVMAAVLVALSLAPRTQIPPPPPPSRQAPARDPARRLPPEPTGTGIIRGRVVAGDTGAPVRHATVNLSMMSPPIAPSAAPAGSGTGTTQTLTAIVNGVPTSISSSVQLGFARPKTAITDAQGAFEFRDLPAGNYRLTASPGQFSAGYLGMAYGAKRPTAMGVSDLGTPIPLADGQTFDKATVQLLRGAVITGRVTDENGDPLARVQVYTVMYLPGSTRGTRTGGGASTDDLGQFRMFGLAPGEYVVVAEARGNSFVPPNAPPETEEEKVGFLTTYFPGTADEGAAQRVRTKTGAETAGIEIHMVAGRLFHISGVVTDSQGRPGVRTSGTLFKRTTGTNFSIGAFGFSTDEQGRFQMRNIQPGNYRLTVRQQPTGGRNPDGSPVDAGEFANVPLTIASDMDDLLITTSTGVTITGTVVFENGPPQLQGNQQSFQMRVSASFGEPDGMIGTPPPQPALVAPDLTFTMKGMMGEFVLRTSAPNNFLKSVQLGGEDITDTPHEFKTGDRVTLVMTSRASMVEGNVTDATGQPVSDASLMLFSEDKTAWRANSLRTRRGGVDQNGHFRMPGVLPGRYFLIALPRDRASVFNVGSDPAAYEALVKDATTVVVGEDEQRQVDVKISAGGGGQQ